MMKVVIVADELTVEDLELMDSLQAGKIQGHAEQLREFFVRFAVDETGQPMDAEQANQIIKKVKLKELTSYLAQTGEGLGVPLAIEKI
jgi:hypothetical protein